MISTSLTEKKHFAFNNAPRCGAKTKNNNGNPCRCPKIRGKARCRIHGGAKGSGAKRGNSSALKQGNATNEVKAFKKKVHQLLKESRELAQELD